MEDSQVTVFILLCCVFSLPQLHCVNVTIEPAAVPVWFIQGRPLVLTCTVEHEKGQTVDVEWTKYGASVDTTEYMIDSWIDDDGTKTHLQLTKEVSSGEDMASFICTTGDNDQQTQTDMFSVYTTDANVTEGYETTLKCEPELIIKEKVVKWFKGDVPLQKVPELEGRLKLGHDNTTVSFVEAKLPDSGVYSCRIEIYHGTGRMQVFHENVTLHGKPYIMDMETPEALTNVTNTSFVLKCPAGGYPTPDIFWLRGDDVLEPSERILMTSLDMLDSALLTILSPVPEDYGEYTCTAQNTMGKASVTMTAVDPNEANTGNSVNYDGSLGVSAMMCLCVCLLRKALTT